MCTVTKIHYHSVFVRLDEYERRQGLIHISEISHSRIRNISDMKYKLGQELEVKVIDVDRDNRIKASIKAISPKND